MDLTKAALLVFFLLVIGSGWMLTRSAVSQTYWTFYMVTFYVSLVISEALILVILFR